MHAWIISKISILAHNSNGKAGCKLLEVHSVLICTPGSRISDYRYSYTLINTHSREDSLFASTHDHSNDLLVVSMRKKAQAKTQANKI